MPVHRRATAGRRHRLLNAIRLEDRLAPAISILGPHTPQEIAILEDTAGAAWSALAQLPNVNGGLTSLYEVSKAWYFGLEHDTIRQHLEDAPYESAPGNHTGFYEIMVPRPDGSFQNFNVWEVSTMEPGLAAQFPTIKTYRGQGIDDPYATLSADITPAGFHAQVLSTHGDFYLEPYYQHSTSVYIGYYKQHNFSPGAFFCTSSGDVEEGDGDSDGDCGCGHDTSCGCLSCLAASGGTPANNSGIGLFNSSNGLTLREYRLAVAATGEYVAFHGGTVVLGQAAVVTAVNRVNQVYESQLSVRMNLVANNSLLIYTDAATDPYTNGNGSAMLTENQNNIDAVIMNANYDIGHVFSTGGGGVAGLGVVGTPGQKARGVTGQSSPIGDSFWIDYVAHEMGHQYGGNHTFNGVTGSCAGNRSGANAYEQGSGSTIMAYAGICGTDDLQPHSDAYFHWRSLDEISTEFSSGNGVGFIQTPTGNAIPVVDAGSNFTIPALTPFALTGTATDADGDPLTYLWEEADLGPATTVSAPDNGTSPLFRSFNPSTSPTRTVPSLTSLISNTNSIGEVFASTNRTLNWRLTAFDNRVTGAFAFDAMALNVVNTGAAFAVTTPNSGVSWQALSSQIVTWNVAGTTGNGINAGSVNILLSTDGGFTFPTVLASNVANDGSEVVTIPNTPTALARIKVQPTNNVFFDFSNVNFTIAAPSPFQLVSANPAHNATAAAPVTQFDVTFNTDVKAATISVNDLVVSVGTVANAELLSPTVVRYTLAGLPLDGAVTFTLPTGVLTDNSGNGNSQYIANVTIDTAVAAFPTPLVPVNPLGALAYTGSISGSIGATLDTDSFTVSLGAGQTVTVVATPNSTLRPNISVTGPDGPLGTQSAGAVGLAAMLQTVEAKTAGLYTVTVGNVGGTTGTYTLRLDLNVAAESESNNGAANDTIATAQYINASAIAVGSGVRRYAARGVNDPMQLPLSVEIEPNNSGATANDARFDFEALSSSLYQMSLTGTIGVGGDANDYFNIGALQVGDVITISQSGSISSRGTMLDPLVNLYRSNGGAGLLVLQNNNGGPTSGANGDALIYRFSITVADTYYINAQRSGTTTSGTYQLGVWLENTGTAPATGGTLIAEGTAANGQISTAENASSSWRGVSYLSTINADISAGDSDYYRYDFNVGDVVTFVADSTSTLDARINLRNSAAAIIATENGTSTGPGTDSPMYAYRITTAGTYYLEVLAASGTGTYSSNVYLSSATTPPAGLTGDDFYRVTLASGETANIALEGDTAGFLHTLELFDNAGNLLATGAAGPTNFDKALRYTATAPGNYLVRVTGGAGFSYFFTMLVGAEFDKEGNNSFGTAQPLTLGRAVGGMTGDDDWYSISATAGQLLTLSTLTPGDGTGEPQNLLDPAIELYDPNGVLIGSDDNSAADLRNAVLSKAAGQTGEYRARILGVNGTTGTYRLNLDVTADVPAQVVSAVVNDGNPQRSLVESITVTFSEVVQLPTPANAAFQLTRTGPGLPNANVDVTVDTSPSTASQTIAKLTFSGALTEFGSIIDGLYTMTIFANQVADSGLQMLDGDGDNIAGGNYVLNLHRLFGDSNADRTVNALDFAAFRAVFGLGASIFDFDDANGTNTVDFAQFRARFGLTI